MVAYKNLPVMESVFKFVARKQAVAFRIEHIKVSRPLCEYIYNRMATFGDMVLYVAKHLIGTRAVKEHEQPDCNDNIKVCADVVALQIGATCLYGESLFSGNLTNTLDCSGARIERHNTTAASRSFYCEIAHSATEIKNAAVQEGKSHFLKRVEVKIAVPHLLLELLVEKLDTAIHWHSMTPDKAVATLKGNACNYAACTVRCAQSWP
jgi:hypothetical protein